MTNLPEIDPAKVSDHLINKIATENLELRKQIVSLELLATALRDERDEARNDLATRDSRDLVGDVVSE